MDGGDVDGWRTGPVDSSFSPGIKHPFLNEAFAVEDQDMCEDEAGTKPCVTVVWQDALGLLTCLLLWLSTSSSPWGME